MTKQTTIVKDSHTMTITDGVPVFACSFSISASCYQYPDCECESWVPGAHEHPSITHAECLLAGWFKHPGDTREMFIEDGSMMPENASGPIEVEWDDCPLWFFTKTDEVTA
ncbi:hypothetical protein [Cryobacterium psychrophilum]|uniref:Uncharacterized protein n=1 Tax=Cryobacterium psychrophilum TaxID=41988 RepID=A0A4Y8KWH1_9MICO|nr:hypothetical protein [Cryobacterium psychrophilum]TDW31003.1 hypothetical protein EDD25_2791 [Cryobacterium psychrophilum]TFD80861.1 hypothetical protein E3T53_04355 [Cryobacterium psychrophilum]